MNMKEKLESLGRNSIQLKIARKETYKLGATRFGGKPDVPDRKSTRLNSSHSSQSRMPSSA